MGHLIMARDWLGTRWPGTIRWTGTSTWTGVWTFHHTAKVFFSISVLPVLRIFVTKSKMMIEHILTPQLLFSRAAVYVRNGVGCQVGVTDIPLQNY